MAREDIGGALGRFNDTLSHGEPEGDEGKGKPKEHGGGEGKGHSFHVHKHTDGTHHLTVHGSGGLTHHSEHPSLQEAADEMKNHGEE